MRLPENLSPIERLYIADRVRDLLTDVRKGEAWLLAERLERIAVLLEQPALVSFLTHGAPEANLEATP